MFYAGGKFEEMNVGLTRETAAGGDREVFIT